MKRFFGMFVLTPAEQRLVIVFILLLVAGAWLKHHCEVEHSVLPPLTPGASPTPQGAAISKSPTG